MGTQRDLSCHPELALSGFHSRPHSHDPFGSALHASTLFSDGAPVSLESQCWENSEACAQVQGIQ